MKKNQRGLDIASIKQFRNWYSETLAEKLICISHEREAYWSEAVAVGAPDWLKRAAKDAGIKRFTIKDNNSDIDKSAYIHFLAGKN